jgi:hypothetical protein
MKRFVGQKLKIGFAFVKKLLSIRLTKHGNVSNRVHEKYLCPHRKLTT